MKTYVFVCVFAIVFGAIGVSAAAIETPVPGHMSPFTPTVVDCSKTCSVAFYDAGGNAAVVHVRSKTPVYLWTTFNPRPLH